MTRTRTPTPPPQQRRGAAGLWLLACTLALAAGLALGFSADHGAPFWAGARPGGAAALGAAGAVFALLAARIARWALRARRQDDEAPR